MLTLIGCARALGTPPSSKVSSGLAIVDTTLIDATGAPARPGMTIVIQDGRITSIGPADSFELGPQVEQVDGSGKYLIPGLWDMHTHVSEYAPTWFPVLLANGITGIRNMHSAALALDHKVNGDVQTGALVGPRMIAAGQLVDGPGSPWPTAIRAETPEAARSAVDDLADHDADFIKVYSFLSRDSYLAIADQARRRGIAFAGHVPQSLSALEAASAGQRSIEHLDGVLLAAASDESALRQRFTAASALWRNPATAAEGQAAMIEFNRNLAAHYDETKAQALFAAFVANQTYQTPTLVTHYTNLHRAEPEILENEALRYVPASIREQWLSLAPPNPAMNSSQRDQFAVFSKVVREMQLAGVGLLAGTDSGGTLIVPGDSLHRELALLVDAGLTPMQALQAATLNPAIYLGERNVGGTVEVGKRADLVLLTGNPLEDIGNTRSIAAVVRGGTLYRRSSLDRMLAAAEVLAASQ